MPTQPVPQQRIAGKLDEYMSRRDYAGAERHLLYWLDEARAVGDKRGELMVRNELIGHFRKMGNRNQALNHAAEALRLVDELGFGGTISAGTTLTNAGTAFSAFGENERARELFQKAAALYEGSEHTAPELLGGLYNNMALACVALARFDEADVLYRRALATMAGVRNGELEQAITYLNMADAVVAKHDANESQNELQNESQDSLATHTALSAAQSCEEAVEALLDKAWELLDTPSVPRDGYYAFVCEKCAPVFGHYGYFLADGELRKRAEAIYERA